MSQGRGRPRKTMEALVHRGIIPENWRDELLEMGRQGKALVHIVNYLQINWDLFEKLRKRDSYFAETVILYQQLSEEWWLERAREHWINGNSKNINSNHWSLIMRNMFKDRWSERKEVDITSKGNELGQNKIEIEILKTITDEEKKEENGNTEGNK